MSKFLLAGAMAVSMSAFSQTTLFQDDFQTGGANWTLNAGGSGNNQWIINNVFVGDDFGFIGDTPDQPSGIAGNPQSYYLHIYNTDICGFANGCNAAFDTGSASNRVAQMTNNIVTTGFSNVSLSFWYLCAGAAGTSYGTIEYSTDGGTNWTPTGTSYSGVSSWTQTAVTLPAWANQAMLKIRFRWQNGGAGLDPAFAIDDIVITGMSGSFASIATGNGINPSSWCFNTTANITVPFTVSGTIDAGNVYTAQLSNASGSFASPTDIGTLNSTSTGSLSMNATVPAGVPVGAGYRIRVIASNPSTIGTDNGTNLSVLALPNVSILPNPLDGVMCPGESVSMLASGGVAYQWSPSGSLDNAANAQVTATPTVTTAYTVIGTGANGCQNSATFTVTVDDCSAIGENASNAFVLFPNPASETVTIQYVSELKPTAVQLLDNSGRIIEVLDAATAQIPVSHLASGSYIVRIVHESGTAIARFTRQ